MTDKKPSPEGQNKEEKPKGVPNKPDINKEFGGQEGPDPTRYGDWEKGGRCTDF